MARPHKKLDESLIEKLSAIQCSLTEMAAILECHPDTLRDRYSKIIDKGREHGKMSLRRKQYDVAMNGNVSMLIWLGKQYLNQKDKSAEEIAAAVHERTQASAMTQEERLELIKIARGGT